MARMKTGRLTKMTTPPQKNNGGTTNPQTSSQAAWDKYDSDYKAYKNYDSDVKAYNEKKKVYDEEMKGASSGYNYAKFGGKSSTRRLNPTELGEFNKSQSSNNPNALEAEWVDVPKSYKGKVSEAGAYMSRSKAPVAPVRKEEPSVKNLPMDKMPILKAGKASTSTKLAGGKKEKSTEGFFGDYVPSTKGTSNKQLKQFASFASKTGLNESFIGKSKAEIGQYKNEMKSQRKAYAKEGNLAGVKATTADIRQSRNAAKFVGSKNPMDVPGMVTGYRKEQERESYRQGFDNPANRNTIKSQVDRLKKLR